LFWARRRLKRTAAGAVEVRARHHGVDALGFVANGDTSCIILVVAESRVKVHSVDGHAPSHEDGVLRRVNKLVPLMEVVAHRALVIHLRYHTVQVGTKSVVRSGISKTARLQHADVDRRAVGRAGEVIQGPVIGRVQRAGCGVGGHTGIPSGGEYITRTRSPANGKKWD